MSYCPIVKPAQRPVYEATDSPRLLTVLINHDSCGAEGVLAGMSLLYPGQYSPYDVHPDMQEVFYVISGRGTARIDDVDHRIEAQDAMYVRNGSFHQFRADADSSLHLFWFFNAHPDEEFQEKFKKWKPVSWPLLGKSPIS
jgi:mannose-6-phosphate isomerase-like protein (cupin superfamily)